MAMPRGLIKTTAYYNRIESWRDFRKLAAQVEQAGYGDLVKKHQPPETAGWRRVDKAAAKLKAAFVAAQQARSHTSEGRG